MLTTVISLIQVWNHTLFETRTHKHAHAHTQTHAHTKSVWCSVSFISQCWNWVNRFIFSPLVHMGNLSVFTKVVCVYVCVWECEFLICRRSDLSALYLHMRTMWLTAMPYLFALQLHHMHACMHVRTHTHPHPHTLRHMSLHTSSCANVHIYLIVHVEK